MFQKKGKRKLKNTARLKVLFDTGCGSTLINHSAVKKLKQKSNNGQKWMTKVGSFSTSKTCKVTFALPQFHKHREITWKMHVENTDSKKNTYDMIIGRDLMHEMGLNIDFQKGRMVWDNAWVNMQNPDHFRENLLEEFEEELFLMHDPDTTEAERIQRIVDVKYSPANLEEEVKKADLLNKQEQQELLKLLMTLSQVRELCIRFLWSV